MTAPHRSASARAELAEDRLREANRYLATCEKAIALFVIRDYPVRKRHRCINCGHFFARQDVRGYYGVPRHQVGPFCEACYETIKRHEEPIAVRRKRRA